MRQCGQFVILRKAVLNFTIVSKNSQELVIRLSLIFDYLLFLSFNTMC